MLQACHDVAVLRVVSLITAHHCLGYARAEKRILASAFSHTAPPRVHANVHHRAESPVYSVRARLLGSYARALLYGFHVPAARLCERDGEYGLISVNDVHAHKQRYSQTAFLHSHLLQGAYAVHSLYVEDASYTACRYLSSYFRIGCLAGCDVSGNDKIQLSYLLLDCHLGHKPVHKCLHFMVVRHHRRHRHQYRQHGHNNPFHAFLLCVIMFLIVSLIIICIA